jgi:predicted ATPase
MKDIASKLTAHEQRIADLEGKHSTMETAVKAIQDNTDEIVGILRDAKGAWRVFEMIGKAAKPLAWIAALIAAGSIFWNKLKGGV